MKTKLLAVSLSIAAAASAATVSTRSGESTPQGTFFTLNDGTTALTGGFVGIGQFSVPDAQITAANAASSFVPFSGVTPGSRSFGSGAAAGSFSGDFDFGSTVNNANNGGQQIYLIFGNESTLASSTEIGVYLAGVAVPTDVANSPTPELATVAVSANSTGAAALVGTLGTDQFGETFTLATVGAAIPEPSSSLLALAGLAGLAARRRR